jgi:hypothetical protein
MRNKLLLIAVLAITLTACEKEQETVFVPTPEDAYWYLHIEGQPNAPFRVFYSINIPPFTAVDYSEILCCNISPILIKMQVGKPYVVTYMGLDSIFHSILHEPTAPNIYRDTIPATTW